MTPYRIRLTALDDRVITERTGVISEEGVTTLKEPIEFSRPCFFWKDGHVGESPGIIMNISNIVKVSENTYEFEDYEKRPFRLEYLQEEKL